MKVSVSVTTYNHERFIARALDGILAQRTAFDFEVVVGDDCSTDGTWDIVLDYRRRHPGRIRLVRPDRNLGRNGTPMFVETLRLCRGQYVAMQDGDDYWTAEHKLQRQADFLDAHPECSLCYHNADRVHDDGSRPPSPSNPEGHPAFATLDDILVTNFVSSPSPMVRREVVARLPDWFGRSPFGDYPLYLLAADRGPLGFISEAMAVYRIHPGGTWSSGQELRRARDMVEFFAGIDGELLERNRAAISRVLARRLLTLARVHASRGELRDAARYALAALAKHPAAALRSAAGVLRERLASPPPRTGAEA